MLQLSSKKNVHKTIILWYNKPREDAMESLSELQKNTFLSLLKLESELGHYVFKKKEKSVSKEILDSYWAFNKEADSFRELQDTIRSLDTEHAEIKVQISELKILQKNLQKEIKSMYLLIGKALFEKYTPVIADVFGKEYTQICVEDRKIAEAKEKEEGYRSDTEKNTVFSKIVNQAKIGATKAQVAAFEQKKEHLFEQGAKSAIDSGKLVQLVKKDFQDIEVKKLLDTFSQKHKDVIALERSLENLSLNDGAIKSSLEKAGVSSSPKKRLQALDRLIEQKRLEQDDFCAKNGHEYASRYVSPDGEVLVEFPKGLDKMLLDIQVHKRQILSLSRLIEIENAKKEIEKVQKEKEYLLKDKDSNIQKIQKLQTNNVNIDTLLVEKNELQNELNKKITILEKEEEKAKKVKV